MKVNIKSNKMGVNIGAAKIYPELSDLAITPTTQSQEFSGKYKKVNVSAVDNTIDENIVADNIKNGVSILGIEGTITAPEGTTTITENGTHDVKNYELANVNIHSYPPDWQQIGYQNSSQYVLDSFNYAKTIYDNWDETITSMANMYNGNNNIKFFPLVNTENVVNMESAFYASSIIELPLINTENVTRLNQAFYNCKNLIYIPRLNTKNVSMMLNAFSSCQLLNNESLNNILGMCASAQNYTMLKRLSSIGLSQQQAAICITLSNWSAAQQAGWSTGYNIE